MFTSQRKKQGTLQGTQSQHTKANLAKSLVFLLIHGKHPKFDKDYQIRIDK